MSKDVVLTTNIDLDTIPWVGMVIGDGAVFDGGDYKIKILSIRQYIMNQQGTEYSPEVCVGLFAAAYKGAKIQNVTLDGVTINKVAGSPKWVGSLVGYSYGASLYENCHAKNVDISLEDSYSYRVGGLVGLYRRIL